MIRLFRVSIPTSIVLLVFSESLLLIGCFILGAYFGLDRSIYPTPWLYLRYENGFAQVLVAVLTVQLGLYLMDLYENPFPRSRVDLAQQLCMVMGVTFLLQAIVGYSEWLSLQLPQWTMVYGSIFTLAGIILWRWIFGSVVRRALPKQKLLFLGCPPMMREIAVRLQERQDMGYTVAGYIGEPEPEEAGIAHLGTLDDLEKILERYRPEAVIVNPELAGLSLSKLLDLKVSGLRVETASAMYETVFGRISIWSLAPSQMVFSPEFSPRPWTLQAQTLYGYLLGLIGFILALPLIVLGAVLVKCSSPGPVLYRQKRVGLRGRQFSLYKLRSMYIDAEARTGPVWATKDDPRITPVGRWLRKSRLDELPQFFNVLRGEMALVGPRPERPEFCSVLEGKIPYFHQRHLVKPGITGWAQINHRYADTIEDVVTKLEYDLYYVKHLAPALDAYILFHTAKVMLLSRGAQ